MKLLTPQQYGRRIMVAFGSIAMSMIIIVGLIINEVFFK